MQAFLSDRPAILHFARFITVGALNTLVGYLLFGSLTLLGLGPSLAVVGSTILGIMFNFQSFGRLIFGGSPLRLLPRFLAAYAFLAVLNIGLLHLAMNAGFSQLLAQAVVLPPVVLLNFVLMRRYVFRLSPPPAGTIAL